MPQIQKEEQFSPVLELSYIMLTNIARYLDVYAADIDATDLSQYNRAKDALSQAIKAFDVIFTAAEEVSEEDYMNDEGDEIVPPVPTQTVTPATQPYQFASGDDESLEKAKQAVEELKTLFSDMKKQEEARNQTQQPANVVAAPQVTSAPQFPAAPVYQAPQYQAPQATPVQQHPQAQQDAGDVEAILAELRKLQNKGNQQL